MDEPLVWYAGPAVTSPNFMLANYQGSIMGYSNSSGSLTELYRYDPYGRPTSSGNIKFWYGSRFRYTGQYAIPEAELYYYKARVYDPNYGRFLQTDPIGSKDDLNMYAYVGGDPINKGDPMGLAGCGDISGTQCTELMNRQDEAIASIDNVQSAIDLVIQERAAGGEMSANAVAAEQVLANAFGDADNSTLLTVSANLSSARDFLTDPGTANGGRYDYRYATSDEMRNPKAGTSAMFRNPSDPNTVAIGGSYRRVNNDYRSATMIHEALHVMGLDGFQGQEYYGRYAIELAREYGSSAALQNPENYVCATNPSQCR